MHNSDKTMRNLDAFINEMSKYSVGYFYPRQNKIENIRYCQNSEKAEKIILGLPFSRENIIHKNIAMALAWKNGKIKNFVTEETGKIVYAIDWKDCEVINPKRYGKEFDINSLSLYIRDKYYDIEQEILNDNPVEAARIIQGAKVKGVGGTYAITLLFFLSRGKYPIFDRFAGRAIGELCGERILKEKSCYDNSDMFSTKFTEAYQIFIIEMKKIMDIVACGKNYMEYRELDQALWVYGHSIELL